MIQDDRDDEALRMRLFDLLEDVDTHLDQGDLEAAQKALAAARELAGDEHPDVGYAAACVTWEQAGPGAAEPLLERVVAADPEHADARYALARAAEERGDHESMIEHHLHVHVLDARADREARIGSQAELDHIERVAYEVVSGVPAPFAERLAHVPVLLERRPSRDLVRDGFDPRALGLFDGPIHGDHTTAAPTRIVLFVNNLLADFPEDPELSDQIEITLLHEIGHFFGLDEDDMERLGLD